MGKYNYAADVYGQSYQSAQQASAANPWAPSAAEVAEEQAGGYSVAQGTALLHAQQGQGYRDGLAQSEEDALGYDHPALFGMVNDGTSAEQIDAHGRILNDFANMLNESADASKAAADSTGADWRGLGGGQVAGSFREAGGWLDHTGQGTALAANRYSQQSAAVDHARREMPPPSNFDQNAEMTHAQQQLQAGDLQAGVDTMNGIAAKQQAAQAAHEKAAQVVSGMNGGLYETGRTMPVFVPPTQPGGPGHEQATAASSVSTPAGAVLNGPGGPSAAGPVAAGQFGGGPGPVPATPGGVPVSGGSGPLPGGYPSGVGPGAPGPGTSSPGGGFPAGGQSRLPAAGLGSGGPGGPGAAGVAGGGGFGRTGEDVERTGRSRPGFGSKPVGGLGKSAAPRLGRIGAPGEPGAGERAGRPGSVEERLGGGKGSGAGGRSAAESLARGGAASGATGKAGAPGGAAAPAGGRGKGEDEKERKTRFVEDTEQNEAFGADISTGPDGVKVVPPVIGS